ncbi:MAG: HAMP domain-containing histidine kinase [Alistipes sp.]|nr:HAMP domain-containing histidine kinase [Alistipes sp.]
MSDSYKQQICSVLEEAAWKYASNSMNGDTSISIGNISRFNALVGEGLRTAGLATEYRVEVLSTTDTEPITIMSLGNLKAQKELSVDKYLTPLILRLTVTDPSAAILQSMRIMLLLQLLSIAILAVTLLYLLRTLFRAKKVDKIRRDLTHNISHELKTPIAAAYTSIEALRTLPALAEQPDTRNEYLDISLGELKRLSGMVEEILRTSTEEFANAELRIEECDIATIIEHIRLSFNLKYTSRSIQWDIDIEEGCAVVGDSFYLEGAISALVDNAIKYSTNTPAVSIEATTKSGHTYISIKDHGIGIARSEQRRIFDKFYRVVSGDKYSTSGYGIGLYYVHSIVTRHNGSINVVSSLGEGACFTIKLPRYGK